MGLNNRYSQHAHRALSQARLLAQDFQHTAVDTDHLFVGILRETGSLGAQALHDLGVDACRAELEIRVLHPVDDLLGAARSLTDALGRVLILAADESRWFGHHYIGTEHLLLAVARCREGGASDLLRTLALSPDQIRRRVRLMLNDGMTELGIEAAKRKARLSELSRRALNAAGQLASLDQEQVPGLDHLLLVLAQEQRSIVSRMLHECGLDQPALEAAIARSTPPRDSFHAALLESVIDHAVDRADQLGTHYTGTDHILLAVAENAHGKQLLAGYGVDVPALIKALYRDLRPSSP